MGRCPWHGSECDCDGTTDPYAGRFAKWVPIDGKCPPWCEDRIPLDMIAMYRGKVSDAKWQAFEAMMKRHK